MPRILPPTPNIVRSKLNSHMRPGRFDQRNTHWVAYSTEGPGMESLWFRAHGTTFIANVTFHNGPDIGVAARMLHSLRVVPARH